MLIIPVEEVIEIARRHYGESRYGYVVEYKCPITKHWIPTAFCAHYTDAKALSERYVLKTCIRHARGVFEIKENGK